MARFHDITGAGNQCNLGAAFCPSAAATSYMAGVGYDLASGLGSIDLANLVAAWPATPAARLPSTQTEVGFEGNTLGAGTQQRAFVSVMPLAYGNNVTGTLNVSLDGDLLAAAASMDAGIAGIPFTVPARSGTYVLTARYSGDAQYAASVGSGTFEVGSSTPTGSFILHATNITVPANGTGTGTITVTPASGYTGAVSFSLSVSSSSPTLCYQLGRVSAYTGMPTSITLTLGTGTACSAPLAEGAATSRFHRLDGPQRAANRIPRSKKHGAVAPVTMGGLLLSSLCLWRRRTWYGAMVSVLLITSFGFGLNGCGGSKTGTTSTPALPPTQTLVLTVGGADSISSSIASSTTLPVAVSQ